MLSFINGFVLPAHAFGLILRSRKLLFWSAFPVILTLLLYIYGIGALHDVVFAWVNESLMRWNLDPSGWIARITRALAAVLLWIAGVLTFSFAATAISSPFNDFLAEATEPLATPPLAPVAGGGLRRQARLLLIDLAKTGCTAIAALFALALSWVPVLNLFAFVLTVQLLSFQYLSYPQTRREVRFTQGLAFIRAHFAICAGFGTALLLLFAIPFAACFVVPLGVVGGTLLYAQRAPANPAH